MTTAKEVAYEGVRGGILEGRYSLGERINEVDLAKELGVSRTPIREALRRLATEGLVDLAFNRGARVANWGKRDLEEVYELRAVLESYAASRAARRISDGQLELLTRLCNDEGNALLAPDASRLSTVIELNRKFHSTVVAAADNQRLCQFVDALIEIPSVLATPDHYGSEGRLEHIWHDHMRIVEALRQRNGDWAASLMRAHMLSEEDTLLRESGEDGYVSLGLDTSASMRSTIARRPSDDDGRSRDGGR